MKLLRLHLSLAEGEGGNHQAFTGSSSWLEVKLAETCWSGACRGLGHVNCRSICAVSHRGWAATMERGM